MISSPSGSPVAVKPPHTTSEGIAATFATVVSSGRENPSSGRCSVSSGAEPAEGIFATVVNGQVLYDQGKHTGALPGQVLRNTYWHDNRA